MSSIPPPTPCGICPHLFFKAPLALVIEMFCYISLLIENLEFSKLTLCPKPSPYERLISTCWAGAGVLCQDVLVSLIRCWWLLVTVAAYVNVETRHSSRSHQLDVHSTLLRTISGHNSCDWSTPVTQSVSMAVCNQGLRWCKSSPR